MLAIYFHIGFLRHQRPRIVRTTRVMGFKPEEIIQSLRVQKFNEVIATYLILQHQSPRGDSSHHQVKALKCMHQAWKTFTPSLLS